jgi:hypothetical protein
MASNIPLALSRSDSRTKINRPKHLTNRHTGSSPTQSPDRYKSSEAASPPAVDAAITGTNAKRPSSTRNSNGCCFVATVPVLYLVSY